MARLLLIAVLTSVIGILIILYIAENKEVRLLEIKDIDESYLDQVVRIKGTAGRVGLGKDVTIINLNDGLYDIKVIAFDNSTLIKDGMPLEVYGVVTMYKGEIEVEADEIKVG
ncbi:MAG TPA: hypothetical protein VJJ53_01310 [Candidatus Nanoarchaeia archaeon]|nr:hypothetical protein [Candidatus Nanoarchaeia archaeon]